MTGRLSSSSSRGVDGQRKNIDRLQVQLLGGSIDVDSDNVAVTIDINDDSIGNLSGFDTWLLTKVDIKRIGFWVVMKFHVSDSELEPSASVKERIVDRLTI